MGEYVGETGRGGSMVMMELRCLGGEMIFYLYVTRVMCINPA
jgi:hypothetical protein